MRIRDDREDHVAIKVIVELQVKPGLRDELKDVLECGLAELHPAMAVPGDHSLTQPTAS